MVRKSDRDEERSSPSGSHADLEANITRVGARLCRSLSDVLAALPGPPRRPLDLSKALGVNKDLASKTLLATNTPDPLAATHSMPGPEALRTLLKAAARRKVDEAVVGAANDAVSEFEGLLRNVVGSRSELDAILATWLTETRDRFEMSNKQAAFKANCGLKGIRAEVASTTAVCYPSGDERYCDVVLIEGRIGLRRLRPGTPIRVSTQHTGPQPPGFTLETLGGEAVDHLQANAVLRDFCSEPPPALEIRTAGKNVRYIVASDGIGLDSAVNLFLAQVARRSVDRYQNPAAPCRKGFGAEVEIPVKTLLFDVLLHESVWPRCKPDLLIFDTTIRGVADINDPGREMDRMELLESIQPLGQGTAKFRVAEIPNYVELIRQTCRQLGWNSEAARGYRCRIQYPFYGSQMSMAFDSPNPPSG